MTLSAYDQTLIHAAVKAYIEALAASGDNPAALPALYARRAQIRANLLGPMSLALSEEKFWCLFDEMVQHIRAGGNAVSNIYTSLTGQKASDAEIVALLLESRRQLGA